MTLYTYNRHYPWDQWLDGKTHWLKRGVHFHNGPSWVADYAHKEAAKRGLQAETSTRGKYLSIRAFPKVR